MEDWLNVLFKPEVMLSGLGVAGIGFILRKMTRPAATDEAPGMRAFATSFQSLAEEHGVAKVAIQNFFKEMKQKDVPPEEWGKKLQEFAQRLQELEQRLAQTEGVAPDIQALRDKARQALEKGDLDASDGHLADASRLAEEKGHDYLRTAASAEYERGDLAETRVDYVKAAEHMKKAAALTPEAEPLTKAGYLNHLGKICLHLANWREAEAALKTALSLRQDILPDEDPALADSLNNLATLYHATNRMEKAEPLMERALAIDEAALGKHHPDVARDLNNLARLYQDTNRMEMAEPLMERAVKILTDSLGPDHPKTQTVINNLARLRADMGAASP